MVGSVRAIYQARNFGIKFFYGPKSNSIWNYRNINYYVGLLPNFAFPRQSKRQQNSRYLVLNPVCFNMGVPLMSKVFAVTGGASGMGAATCRLLAKNGAAAVCVGDWNTTNFTTMEEELKAINPSTQVLTTKLDVSQSSSVNSWIGEIIATFGRLDGAANVAGVPQVSGARKSPTILEETDEAWRRTMSVNIDGIFYCTRAEVKAMVELPKRRRAIVNVASLASMMHTPDTYAYGASKRACASFSSSVAKDVLPFGIRVNTVSPGISHNASRRRLNDTNTYNP